MVAWWKACKLQNIRCVDMNFLHTWMNLIDKLNEKRVSKYLIVPCNSSYIITEIDFSRQYSQQDKIWTETTRRAGRKFVPSFPRNVVIRVFYQRSVDCKNKPIRHDVAVREINVSWHCWGWFEDPLKSPKHHGIILY